MTTEAHSSTVAAPPTQGEEARPRWDWVEPSVWTERMLAALDNGVKGGKIAFFHAHGLVSLAAAHAAECQSLNKR